LAELRVTERDFASRVETLRPKLVAFAYRMVAHRQDAEELVQDALLKAHRALPTFRGEARLETWLFSILTRGCLDHLRARRRWRWDAQEVARLDPGGAHGRVHDALSVGRFEAREHIAYCFSCVTRSLSPEEAAALLLREVFGYSNDEASRICDVSEPVLRHRLSAARAAMKDAFDDLCGLVSKHGVCHQCAGLRGAAPPDKRGPAPPDLSGERDASFRRRLSIVRDADLERGASAALHELLFGLLTAQEQ
jgi:RNA polymerase sigma-70 factor, ECF subfamily